MSDRHFGWPTYLAVLVGVGVTSELLFDVVGLSEFSLAIIAIFVVSTIIFDFLTNDLPSMSEEEDRR